MARGCLSSNRPRSTRILLTEGTEGALKETGSGPRWAVTQNLAEWVFRGQRPGRDHWKIVLGLNVFDTFCPIISL